MNKYDFINSGKIVKQTFKGKSVERRNLPKTDLGCDKGSAFYMAFLFLPTGTEIFTGSWNRIEQHTKRLPLCHGVTIVYCDGEMVMRLKGTSTMMKSGVLKTLKEQEKDYRKYIEPCKSWGLFGKVPKNLQLGRKKIDNRNYWIIYSRNGDYFDNDDITIVAKYRKLPNEYLRFFKNMDKLEK